MMTYPMSGSGRVLTERVFLDALHHTVRQEPKLIILREREDVLTNCDDNGDDLLTDLSQSIRISEMSVDAVTSVTNFYHRVLVIVIAVGLFFQVPFYSRPNCFS